jgi:hypothetical protein
VLAFIIVAMPTSQSASADAVSGLPIGEVSDH